MLKEQTFRFTQMGLCLNGLGTFPSQTCPQHKFRTNSKFQWTRLTQLRCQSNSFCETSLRQERLIQRQMCSLEREPILLFLRQIYSALKIFGCQSEITFVEMGHTHREVNRSAFQIVFFERECLLIKSNGLNPGGKSSSELTRPQRVSNRPGWKISTYKVMCDQSCDGIKIILINRFERLSHLSVIGILACFAHIVERHLHR